MYVALKDALALKDRVRGSDKSRKVRRVSIGRNGVVRMLFMDLSISGGVDCRPSFSGCKAAMAMTIELCVLVEGLYT